MERTPQSTARRYLMKAFLASDGKTAATGKTIPVTISKNGGALGNPSAGATNLTEIGNGWYYWDASTTDNGTLGPLLIRGAEGTIDDVERIVEVTNAFNNGFTGVPAAAADAAGGLPVSDAGGLDLDAILAAVAASAIRAALGISSANLDTQLADLPTNAELASALGGLNDPTTAAIATAVLGSVIEGAVTLKQSLQLANAANAGKTVGMGGASVAIRDLEDSKDRITATVDENGTRSAVTRNYD